VTKTYPGQGILWVFFEPPSAIKRILSAEIQTESFLQGPAVGRYFTCKNTTKSGINPVLLQLASTVSNGKIVAWQEKSRKARIGIRMADESGTDCRIFEQILNRHRRNPNTLVEILHAGLE